MSFKFENEGVYLEYNEILNKIKKTLGIRFHKPTYDDKYIKIKVKTFNGVINTAFLHNEIPKERNHYICIATMCIDSIMKIDKELSSSLSGTMQIHDKEEKVGGFY